MKQLLQYLLRRLRRIASSNEGSPDGPFTNFNLECTKFRPVSGELQVTSFSLIGAIYRVSLDKQTCSCPDFVKRQDQALNCFPRWCKHLITSLDYAGGFKECSDWYRAIADAAHGGPLGALMVQVSSSQSYLVTAGQKSDWINVYGVVCGRGRNDTLSLVWVSSRSCTSRRTAVPSRLC